MSVQPEKHLGKNYSNLEKYPGCLNFLVQSQIVHDFLQRFHKKTKNSSFSENIPDPVTLTESLTEQEKDLLGRLNQFVADCKTYNIVISLGVKPNEATLHLPPDQYASHITVRLPHITTFRSEALKLQEIRKQDKFLRGLLADHGFNKPLERSLRVEELFSLRTALNMKNCDSATEFAITDDQIFTKEFKDNWRILKEKVRQMSH